MKRFSAKRTMRKINQALGLDHLPSAVRRMIIGLVGGTVLLIGLALTVLPGPAFVVIPVGLAILASEFAWAGKILVRVHRWFKACRNKLRRRRQKPA
jgi:hypothetical protein